MSTSIKLVKKTDEVIETVKKVIKSFKVKALKAVRIKSGDKLEVTAQSTVEDATYEWEINRGRHWTKLATGKTLSLAKALRSLDGSLLRVIVKHDSNSIVSNVVKVSVAKSDVSVSGVYPRALVRKEVAKPSKRNNKRKEVTKEVEVAEEVAIEATLVIEEDVKQALTDKIESLSK